MCFVYSTKLYQNSMAAKRIVTNNFVFSLSQENLKDFLKKIEDLTKIDEKMMLSIDKDEMLIYSMAGESNVTAFKSHILKTSEIFDTKDEAEFKFIFKNAKKVFKTLSHFKQYDEDVKAKITYNEDGYGERLLIKNSKLKLEVSGGLPATFSQNVSVDQIEKNMDIDKSNFSFRISKTDFEQAKKLGTIDTENEVYTLLVKDNKVIIGERGWTLEIDEIESQNEHLTFPKKYFNTIIYDEDIDKEIYVFSQFILLMSDTSTFMITTELRV